ncbi:hypothetical protein MBLNU230_g0037t1 [Neophaeotheca triangularis]
MFNIQKERVSHAMGRIHRPKLSVKPKASRCFPGNPYTNADLDPVPFTLRTWTWYNIGGFWISEGFSIPILQMAGSIVASGLSPGMAMGAIVIGTCLITVPCALSGYAGAKTGLNYPCFNRASWGVEGSKAAVAIRAIVAIFWSGVQMTTGGDCVELMLRAIWPDIDERVPNQLPESANITSLGLLCFFLFFLLHCPFMLIHISKLRWIFLVKLIIVPIGGLALFIWCLVMANGFGPVFSRPTDVGTGRSVAFVFFSSVTSAIGPQATFALNMGDFCRYAKSPRAALWSQIILCPIATTLTTFLGVVLASASARIYSTEEVPWNPLETVRLFDSRAAMFFCALWFSYITLVTNVAANTVAFANDVAVILPKYISIRRGQFICAILGVCVTPWNILASAGNLLTFLNGYSVFLGPLCGVMLTDYFLVRGQQVNITQLYQKDGMYTYLRGWNPRAIVAFLLAVTPNLPGLASAVNDGVNVPVGFDNMYTMNWLFGVVFASVLYYLACKVFPVPIEAPVGHQDPALEYLLHGEVIEGLEVGNDDAKRVEEVSTKV